MRPPTPYTQHNLRHLWHTLHLTLTLNHHRTQEGRSKMKHSLIVTSPAVYKDALGNYSLHTGFVKLSVLLNTLKAISLAPNPRVSKRNPIVREIVASLNSEPHMFPAYSRGLTIACGDNLDRTKATTDVQLWDFDLDPANPAHGILDGGHTALALISYAYNKVLHHWEDTAEVLRNFPAEEFVDVDIPITLIPTNAKGITDISEKRNRSSAVTLSDLAVNRGAFDYLQSVLSPTLGENVAWSVNDTGRSIKVRDLVTLIAYPVLGTPIKHPLTKQSPNTIAKDLAKLFAKCVALAEDSDHQAFAQSAFDLVEPLTELYDYIQTQLPSLYSKAPSAHSGQGGRRRFGVVCSQGASLRIRQDDLLSKFHRAPLGKHPVNKGFVAPLMFAFAQNCTACVKGRLVQTRNFIDTFDRYAPSVMGMYVVLFDSSRSDFMTFGAQASNYTALKDHLASMIALSEA